MQPIHGAIGPRRRHRHRPRRGFTLIELLIVISIIALLIGILLPSLATARKTAYAVQCQAHLKQLMVAMYAYCTDAKDFLPYTNSQSGETLDSNGDGAVDWLGKGWLYDRQTMMTKAVDPWLPTSPVNAKQEDAQSGAIYAYLQSDKIYHCPLDQKPTDWTPQDLSTVRPLTSYVMNRAMNGWNKTVLNWGTPAFRAFELRQDAVALWEADEEQITDPPPGGDWNDGNNDPTQPVSLRHNNGGCIGMVDGSAKQVTRWQYELMLAESPGPLWSNPLTPDGKEPAFAPLP